MNVFTRNYDETHQQTRDVDRDNQCRQLKLSTDRTATRMMMFLSLYILSLFSIYININALPIDLITLNLMN